MASSAQNAPDGGISRSGEFEGPVDLTGVTAASFALWVRWESKDGVAMSWVRDSDGNYMSLGLEGGRFRLYNGSLSAVYPTTPVAVLGQWYSVVVVTNSTGSALFVNGVSVGTGAVGFAGDGAGTFRLGGGPSGGRVLDGYVVSGGIWNRKLGRAEVKAFHNRGVNLRYAGLPGAGKQLDERLYCLKDGLDPAAVIDEAGEVQERYGFTAFGRNIFLAPDYSARSSSAFDWDVLFHVELADPETGWQLYGYRFYIPELGRWPNRDPIGERGGVNLYAFVGNNGVNRWDIFGLDPWDVYTARRDAMLAAADDIISGRFDSPGKSATNNLYHAKHAKFRKYWYRNQLPSFRDYEYTTVIVLINCREFKGNYTYLPIRTSLEHDRSYILSHEDLAKILGDRSSEITIVAQLHNHPGGAHGRVGGDTPRNFSLEDGDKGIARSENVPSFLIAPSSDSQVEIRGFMPAFPNTLGLVDQTLTLLPEDGNLRGILDSTDEAKANAHKFHIKESEFSKLLTKEVGRIPESDPIRTSYDD